MNPLAKLFNNLIELGFEAFGRYYSSYRGFVVDNEDPKFYGRVKLKVPQIYGNQTMNYWAWPKGNFSGKNYGIQCIPQKGDMVYVEFEFGDTKKPMWTYGHFSKDINEQPEKPTELSDIKNFWFKTPLGHIVEFDDTNKWIRIKNDKGFYIILNETGISAVADKISLVNLDGSNNEPAVLGIQAENRLNDICDLLDDIIQKLIVVGTTDSIVAGSLGLSYATSFSELTNSLQKLVELKTKISNIKSNKVTLE